MILLRSIGRAKHKRSVPIPLVAVFCIFPADGTFLAVADRADAGSVNAFFDKKLPDDVGTSISKTEVIFFAASVVAISFDRKLETSMTFQPRNIGLKS